MVFKAADKNPSFASARIDWQRVSLAQKQEQQHPTSTSTSTTADPHPPRSSRQREPAVTILETAAATGSVVLPASLLTISAHVYLEGGGGVVVGRVGGWHAAGLER